MSQNPFSARPYMQSLMWCCTSCGFAIEGGQPHMECAICESYKEAFIDLPQHLEAAVRQEFGEDNANTGPARSRRKELMIAGGFDRSFRVKGRQNLAVHDPRPSRRFV